MKYTIILEYVSTVNVVVEADDAEEALFKASSQVDVSDIKDNLSRPEVIEVQSHE